MYSESNKYKIAGITPFLLWTCFIVIDLQMVCLIRINSKYN